MTSFTSADRERQRFEHLVLGRHRPRPSASSKAAGKRRKRGKALRISTAVLAPGIEERVALRERWSHKQGTPETHEHIDRARRRPGSLARLYESGAIDKDQLAAADQIAEAYRTVTADVAIRTASLETRIDGGSHGRAEQLQLGRVHADMAYSWWRAAVGGCADALLRIIVHDVGLTIVAREARMSMPRARRLLTDGLDLWHRARRETRREAVSLVG